MQEDIFKLYHVAGDIEILLDQFIEAENAGAEEAHLLAIKARLLSSTEERDKLIASACAHIKNIGAAAIILRGEEARLKERRMRAEDSDERISIQLSKLLPQEKWSNGVHSIGWRKSVAVNIIDQAIIPEEFMKTEVVKTPMKAAIKNVIESGAQVPGCELESRNNIQIR